MTKEEVIKQLQDMLDRKRTCPDANTEDNKRDIDALEIAIEDLGGQKNTTQERKCCRDCKYLSEKHSSIGYECICPDKKYYSSPLAKWKQKANRACIHFVKK